MKSLYDELGISREATADEIKQAYRRLSRETHPDVGGEREDFERLQHAYEVLSDAAARRRYDTIGDDGRTDMETPEQLAADCFRAMLRKGWSAGSDLVKAACDAMGNGLRDHGEELRKWQGDVARLERYARRLRKRAEVREKHPADVLEDAIAAEMEMPRAKVKFHQVAIARLAQALEILRGYEFGEGELRIDAPATAAAKKPQRKAA